jgi:putative membrane protein
VAKNMTDVRWVKSAVSANNLEVLSGQLAARRFGSHSVLGRFGNHMVRDHSKAMMQLLALAKVEKMSVSRPLLLAKHRLQLQELARVANAREFDAKYRRFAVASHKEAEELYRTEIKWGQNPVVRGLAKEQIKTVREHLRHARHFLLLKT